MPITLALHVFMTGANKLVSAKVWFGLSLKCRARLCVRIDALIHANCTHVNKRSKPTRWLHDHNCWENLSFPTLLHGQLRHPKMTSQVSFGEGVFIRAVQIGITNAPDAVAATSPALASRWEDEVSRHRSVESALLARSCVLTVPDELRVLSLQILKTEAKHTELIKRYPPFWCFLSLYCHSTKYDL